MSAIGVHVSAVASIVLQLCGVITIGSHFSLAVARTPDVDCTVSTSVTILIRTQLDDTLAVGALAADAVTLNCPVAVAVDAEVIAVSLSLTRFAEESVEDDALIDADATFTREQVAVTAAIA